jgi:hypothetical protein
MSRLLWSAAALAGVLTTGACSRGAPPSPATGAPAAHTAEAELQRMTVDELAGMLTRNEPVTVVDNNGRARYEQGHIPGARWVGHDEVTAAALPADRNARVVFYCYNEH